MSRWSILSIFAFVFLIAAGLQSKMEIRAGYSKNFEIVQKKKEQNIALLSAVAESLFLTGRRDVIEGHLGDAVKVRLIDFYILTYRGDVVGSASIRRLSPQAAATLTQSHPAGQMLSFDSAQEPESSTRRLPSSSDGDSDIENFRFMATDLGNGWTVRLGINMDRQAFFEEIDALLENENQRMFIAAALLAIFIFAMVSRDLRRAAMGLKKKGSKAEGRLIFSAEAEALSRGVLGFEDEVARLKSDRSRLAAQVLPSLRKEIERGLEPPYEFRCTMVRTDINNFSRIFRDYPTAEFLETINHFFVDCSQIISRYSGLIHEFVGDEIIFYLKDEDHVNSFTAALACLREINMAAEKTHVRTFGRGLYPFRIKSSVDRGTVRFGPLLNGFSIAGTPLISTSRILSAVQERNENTVHFDASNLEVLHPAVQWEDAFSVELKGLDGERRILKYIGHCAVQNVLEQSSLRKLALADFRDLPSLKQIIQFAVRSTDARITDDVVQALKRTDIRGDAALDFSSFVFQAIDDLEQAKDRANLLATLISILGRVAFTIGEFQSLQAGRRLNHLLSHSDERVVANVLAVYSEWQRKIDDGISDLFDWEAIATLVQSPRPRIFANAAILSGMREISDDLTSALRAGLRSRNSEIVKSTQYAVAEINRYYRDVDPVYLRTQVGFCNLVDEAELKVSA